MLAWKTTRSSAACTVSVMFFVPSSALACSTSSRLRFSDVLRTFATIYLLSDGRSIPSLPDTAYRDLRERHQRPLVRRRADRAGAPLRRRPERGTAVLGEAAVRDHVQRQAEPPEAAVLRRRGEGAAGADQPHPLAARRERDAGNAHAAGAGHLEPRRHARAGLHLLEGIRRADERGAGDAALQLHAAEAGA